MVQNAEVTQPTKQSEAKETRGKQSKGKQSRVNHDLLAEVAVLYYEDNLTQAQISKRLATSRSTVSRLLRDARAEGLVSVTINYPYTRDSQLESDLKQRFGLSEARVLRSGKLEQKTVLNGAGKMAADLLEPLVQKNMVLGVSYGSSIAATIHNLNPQRKVDLSVVQILGALGADNPLIEGADLARDLAGKYGATYRYLHAPLMLEDKRMRDLIVQEPLVKDVLTLGRQTDIALVGIGALGQDNDESTSFIWRGYLGKRDISELRKEGAVGNMCAQFFDAEGKVLTHPLNARSVSIGLAALKQVPKVVSVACGANKAAAILGALRGGYIHVLVTDDQTATAVLQMSGLEA